MHTLSDRSCAPLARRRGFTIIELLIVTVIVGLMMAIVAPQMRISESTEIQLAGMQLAQDIDFARTRALSTRSHVQVTFDNGASPSYSGYLDHDGDSTFTRSQTEAVALRGWQTRTLPNRIVYGRGTAPAVPGDAGSGAITWPSYRAQFDSRGLVTPRNGAGTVYIRHASKESEVGAIVVSASGSVRLWLYHDGVWK